MDQDIIKNRLRSALREFNYEKPYLHGVNIYEPTLSHRIALHLENEFRGERVFVDCEYNKNLGNSKMDDNQIKIRPDIIVHKRGFSNENLLLIEVKKGSKDTKRAKEDIQKLQRTKNLSYSVRAFVGILKHKTDIVWINDDTTLEEVIIEE